MQFVLTSFCILWRPKWSKGNNSCHLYTITSKLISKRSILKGLEGIEQFIRCIKDGEVQPFRL